MDTQNTNRQLRYLEEVRIPLHRAGFGTLPLEGEQLPVLWNGTPLCRITGKGSVFYRREDADTPQAEDALYRVEDIAAKTLEYMTAMESAPQLKASGLDGDYRILADFGGTVLAGTPSKHGVQFVTWDWDYRISGYQSGGDRQPSLSSGTAQAGRAWDLLRRPCRTAVDKSGLRRIRSPDRHGPGQPPGYVPHLRRRLCRKDVPPDGPHRSSRQCGGPMVHRGLRGDLAGCAGGLPRTSERIYDRMR